MCAPSADFPGGFLTVDFISGCLFSAFLSCQRRLISRYGAGINSFFEKSVAGWGAEVGEFGGMKIKTPHLKYTTLLLIILFGFSRAAGQQILLRTRLGLQNRIVPTLEESFSASEYQRYYSQEDQSSCESAVVVTLKAPKSSEVDPSPKRDAPVSKSPKKMNSPAKSKPTNQVSGSAWISSKLPSRPETPLTRRG